MKSAHIFHALGRRPERYALLFSGGVLTDYPAEAPEKEKRPLAEVLHWEQI